MDRLFWPFFLVEAWKLFANHGKPFDICNDSSQPRFIYLTLLFKNLAKVPSRHQQLQIRFNLSVRSSIFIPLCATVCDSRVSFENLGQTNLKVCHMKAKNSTSLIPKSHFMIIQRQTDSLQKKQDGLLGVLPSDQSCQKSPLMQKMDRSSKEKKMSLQKFLELSILSMKV